MKNIPFILCAIYILFQSSCAVKVISYREVDGVTFYKITHSEYSDSFAIYTYLVDNEGRWKGRFKNNTLRLTPKEYSRYITK